MNVEIYTLSCKDTIDNLEQFDPLNLLDSLSAEQNYMFVYRTGTEGQINTRFRKTRLKILTGVFVKRNITKHFRVNLLWLSKGWVQ